MKIVKQGAEAVLYKTKYLGKPALLKERQPKKYRNAQLDARIRRQRTKQEAILLHKAKEAGVRTPTLLKIERKNGRIWMEWIEGKQLKKILKPVHSLWCQKIGRQIAKLHAAGIIQGDLTTSNWLKSSRELVLIDFGLGFFSNKIEDQAMDWINFKKTFEATHTNFSQGFSIMFKAYQKSFEKGRTIEKQMKKIEQRTRYS